LKKIFKNFENDLTNQKKFGKTILLKYYMFL